MTCSYRWAKSDHQSCYWWSEFWLHSAEYRFQPLLICRDNSLWKTGGFPYCLWHWCSPDCWFTRCSCHWKPSARYCSRGSSRISGLAASRSQSGSLRIFGAVIKRCLCRLTTSNNGMPRYAWKPTKDIYPAIYSMYPSTFYTISRWSNLSLTFLSCHDLFCLR